jgi:hypothetical protein
MGRQTVPGEISHLGEGFVKGLAIDAVIFGFHENQLKVLIVEHGNTGLFAIPGGYIFEKENINDAAKRVLASKTGLSNVYLEQFYTFGDYDRNNPTTIKKIMIGQGIPYRPDHWILQRFNTVGYYALVDFTKVTLTTDATSDSCEWYDYNKIPPLILDHNKIVKKALETLRENLDKKLLGFNLLPETFTMGELQVLYESVLGTALLRTNFQRKILSFNILERVDKKYTGAANKAPYLYRFKTSGRKRGQPLKLSGKS